MEEFVEIIDAHSHLWLRQDTEVGGMPIRTLDRGRSMFFGDEVQMLPPFMIDGRNSAEVFLSNMDYARVGGAVVVQEFIDGLQNDYLAEVKRTYPDRFKVCFMCRWDEDGFLPDALKCMETGLYAGAAIPGHRLGRPLDGAEFLKMYAEMERRGLYLSLCLHESNRQLREVEHIVSEFPDLKIAVGHFGMAPLKGWQDQIRLALHPNVYIESGGITWLYNSEFYPYPSAVKAIREAAGLVGMDKLMWGSDYPRTITAITYRMSYDFILKSPLLSEREKRAFLGGNARKFFGFGPLPELPYIKNMSE